ncbi:fungal-specific transcription factor domain-containing protein [Rhexocercosporidium sp. MPI-PUGE-AT-0058]|nr:fungal-specific transcription factor domain-containing protein [Rhexocercosporidium sp. MPI-PUGE-AT-0058]
MSPPDFPVRSQPEVDSNTKSPLNRGVQASETVVSTPSSSCRYPILNPLIPVLEKIIPISVACELLELYFEQPGSSLLKFTSPYVLTHILRRRPILHPTHPRATSQGLLFAMLHATAHTADTACFYVPGSRAKICDALYIATVQHLRDSDDWHRMLDAQRQPNTTNGKYSDDLGPTAGTDELLTLILLTVVVSGGTFKADCLRWWRKSINLARILKLNQLDSKRRSEDYHLHLLDVEAMEEKRRLFWLVFCLDRHLALSYNAPLSIFDADILVYLPLPEKLWEDIDLHFSSVRNHRVYGPSMVVSGTGFFEFFLPLMTILGDIVILHHRRLHPRFGTLEDADDTTVVEGLLEKCQHSIHELQESANNTGALRRASTATNGPEEMDSANNIERATYAARVGLVAAYGTHILHVLAVLLYGKWDPLDMLSTSTTSNVADEHNTTANSDDWVTPARFIKCASHAVSGSQAVAAIIKLDPELAFMPYLFGIYLLHGSFILLLFADRMPQLGGPNPEVEEACETIVRAHEICIVTLSTEFQRSFRRILRSTLYAVRSTEPKLIDPARRKALEMYRWTRGGRGLAL